SRPVRRKRWTAGGATLPATTETVSGTGPSGSSALLATSAAFRPWKYHRARPGRGAAPTSGDPAGSEHPAHRHQADQRAAVAEVPIRGLLHARRGAARVGAGHGAVGEREGPRDVDSEEEPAGLDPASADLGAEEVAARPDRARALSDGGAGLHSV